MNKTSTMQLPSLQNALRRYQNGTPRRSVFHELVLATLQCFPHPRYCLDIGAGRGFDGAVELQKVLAAQCDGFVGIEPDANVVLGSHFKQSFSCTLEDAAIPENSIHVAYANFVLEHVANPSRFFEKLHEILVPGGIFLGFTADARHPFSLISTLMDKSGVKDWYLDWLRGSRRYENYPTVYGANTPRCIRKHAKKFRRKDFQSFHRIGQLDYYVPTRLRPAMRFYERTSIGLGLPGSILVVRLVK